MKLVLLTGLMILGSHAQGADYPVLAKYHELAGSEIEHIYKAQSPAEIQDLSVGQRQLAGLGVEIIRLYAEKNPSCKAQFDAFLSEIPKMGKMSLADLHTRYHDGHGLPVAPRHCYLGRSQVIHPVMNIVRVQGTWSEDIRKEIAEETYEVVEHLTKIQKNLDNPPN